MISCLSKFAESKIPNHPDGVGRAYKVYADAFWGAS